MSSVKENSVIDLAGSPLNSHRRATLPRTKRSPRPKSKNNDYKMAPEIINLEADTPPSSQLTMRDRRTAGRKRRRALRSTARLAAAADDDDDDDIVEIISPPNRLSSAAAAAASLNGKDWVSRIREICPLLSRAKVETFLAMARSYSTAEGSEDDNDAIFYTVMTVLAEDPTGTSISEASFAAATVGGRIERAGDSAMKPASEDMQHGRRKVAQLECQCCFAEYDYEVMVSCRSGHLFCKTCLQKHTEQRVFGVGNFGVKPSATHGVNGNHTSKALEILCMASDCSCGFQEGQLRSALSEKVMKKYDELQYAAVIESANMGDISKCPKCSFIAVADKSLPPLLFHCPQCNFKSCKDCGEEYHPNIRCDQVETKNETDGRKTVEEAMTSAMVRTCPRPMCRRKFLKNDGCNKMTCSCGCFICYVCRKEIPKNVAYKHFCQM